MFNPVLFNFFGRNSSVIDLSKIVAYYKFNSNSIDSKNGYNGTDFNMSYVSGKINNSASFNGTSSYIQISDNDAFTFADATSDKPFSISLWFKPNGSGYFAFCNKRSAANNHEWQFDIFSGELRLALIDKDTGVGYIVGKRLFAPTNGVWYHLVGTYNGNGNVSGIKLYVNSVQYVGGTITSGTYVRMRNNNSPVFIGKDGLGGGFVKGDMDELFIYNEQLTASQVTYLYNKGISGIELI